MFDILTHRSNVKMRLSMFCIAMVLDAHTQAQGTHHTHTYQDMGISIVRAIEICFVF